MKNKAQQEIIVTVLLVLIALAAVAAVATFVINNVKNQFPDFKILLNDTEVSNLIINKCIDFDANYYVLCTHSCSNNSSAIINCISSCGENACLKEVILAKDITKQWLDENCECKNKCPAECHEFISKDGFSLCVSNGGICQESCEEYKCGEYKVVKA